MSEIRQILTLQAKPTTCQWQKIQTQLNSKWWALLFELTPKQTSFGEKFYAE
jgi:hypothetical protein